MTRNKAPLLLLAAVLAAVPFAGCLANDDAESSMTLYVKDAATDEFAEIHATFAAVEVLPAGSNAWVKVFEGNRTIELLSLAPSSAKERLAELQLEDRAYNGLSIALTNVVGIKHDGTAVGLTVAGDVLEIHRPFHPGNAPLSLLVDIDVDAGLDAPAGTFTPFAANVQSSADDADGDNISDLEDTDDDNDGIEDAEDDDIDGDNKTDRPRQESRGHFGLCTAWFATEKAREHNGTANSTAFQRLAANATAANATIEDYCAEQRMPGPPESVPEQALEAWTKAMERRAQAQGDHGAPDERPGHGGGNGTSNETRPRHGGEGRPSGDGRPGNAGNETRPGNHTGGSG